MNFNVKCLLVATVMLLTCCTTDTGISSTIANIDEPYKYSSSSNISRYSSSAFNNINHFSIFTVDLTYIGLNKNSHGVSLVMKNNTKYYMSVTINYAGSCTVNGKSTNTFSKSQYFAFNAYEQQESSSSIDHIYHGGLTTIDCSGTILSIVPTNYDESNFQTWTGAFQFSTN